MRNKVFAGVIFFFFSVLAAGLFYTQIIKHTAYNELSEKNRLRVVPLEAPRGKIYDRNGRLIVSNRIAFDVEVVFQDMEDQDELVGLLAEILGADEERLLKRIAYARENPFVPVTIVEDIEKEKAIQIEEMRLQIPGLIVTTRPLRHYPYGESASQVIGYLGKISREELKRYRSYGYHMRDFVGKDGIERRYNDYLRGTGGGLQVEVDSRGRQLRLLAVREPHPGKDIYLSMDIELQEFCSSLMEEKRGAIVAMDPRTGEVLALVSKPDFDPNVFVGASTFTEVSHLLNDRAAFPMINRAISSSYPLGSVFKLVIAAAALETGRMSPTRTLFCAGVYPVGNRIFHCWKEKGHGDLSLIDGIKYSCNVFFYQLGLEVGVDDISAYAFKLGFGRPTGIDVPGETGGFVPTASWKRRRFREAWYKGETANYAIGQGYLLVTPVQAACMVSVFANKGKLVHPFLVERIEDIRLRHGEPQDLGLRDETVELIKKASNEVVNGERGTGHYARSETVSISGKTGTAQNPQGESHAWFVGFAPFDDPALCVAVFIEHGGKGGLDPARFAKRIMEKAKELEIL